MRTSASSETLVGQRWLQPCHFSTAVCERWNESLNIPQVPARYTHLGLWSAVARPERFSFSVQPAHSCAGQMAGKPAPPMGIPMVSTEESRVELGELHRTVGETLRGAADVRPCASAPLPHA